MGPACLGHSHVAHWPDQQGPAPVPIRCWLPADGRTASLLSVHKHVDDLCATAPSLCIGGGNAGDSAG